MIKSWLHKGLQKFFENGSLAGIQATPPHPGRMIAESLEFLHVSASEFARNLGVSPSSVTRILNEKRPITPDMAVRISAALPGPSPEVWLAMQADYDAWQAKQAVDVSHITRYTPSLSESSSIRV